MRKVTLERFAYTELGVLGRLRLPSGRMFYTVEPPWANNQPNVSCIPEGDYKVVRNKTGRHRFYEVTGVQGRSHIEIHPANYFCNPESGKQELWGCIAPGKRLNTKALAGVLDSRAACEAILFEMGEEDFTLSIYQYEPH